MDIPADLLIPMFYFGKPIEAGKRFFGGSILDLAPTMAKLMDVEPVEEREGISVI